MSSRQAKQEEWTEDLLKPDDADYRFSAYFICDWTTGAIAPSPAADESRRRRAEATLDAFALNAPERCKARWRELAAFRRRSAHEKLDDFNNRYFVEDPAA
ncbi:MAG: hypothetical protein HY907_19635 [Deltaproteobacteria bacterium]|nr:hypothetical protein [Deltaproteobacteria bacterium]